MVTFIHTLRGYRWPLLLLGIGVFGFNLIMCFTFTAVGGAEGLERLLELLPEGARALLKAQGALTPDAQSYVATGYRHPIFLISLIGFAVAGAASAIAGEIEKGSILFLLARPVSRTRVIAAKIAALTVGMVLLLTVAFAGTVVGAAANGFLGDLDLLRVLGVEVDAFFLAMAVTGIAFFFSARGNEHGRVLGLVAGLLVALFFVDFLAEIWPTAAFIGPASPFHYYDPVSLSQRGGFPWLDIGVLASVAVAFLAAALLVFHGRDIAR